MIPKNIPKNILKNILKNVMWYLPIGGKLSQAYEGEDIMLWRLFNEELKIKDGFYIDVGAFHPRQYSNTWVLRKRLGFHGINVEPSNRSKAPFFLWNLFTSKRDINLEYVVGNKQGYQRYRFDPVEPSLSKIDSGGHYRYTVTLKEICTLYHVDKIDLLSIDVEGHEFQVLQGHDWRIRPKVIICEINNESTSFSIKTRGYKLYGKTKRNEIYIRVS